MDQSELNPYLVAHMVIWEVDIQYVVLPLACWLTMKTLCHRDVRQIHELLWQIRSTGSQGFLWSPSGWTKGIEDGKSEIEDVPERCIHKSTSAHLVAASFSAAPREAKSPGIAMIIGLAVGALHTVAGDGRYKTPQTSKL